MYLHKGSLWRKWDLHLHTPSSYDYQNSAVTNEQIIDALVSSNIRLAAITDHHVIDLQRIQELQKLGKGKVTILPGIELRSELGGNSSIHYIGIFPEDCPLQYVWNNLSSRLKLAVEDIKEAGGDDSVWASIWDASKVIHENQGIITLHAGKKANSIEEVPNRELFKQALKKKVLKDVDALELGRPDDSNAYEEIVFPAINEYLPLIICSDNHNATNYRLKENCWFRADPNFYGLKQVIVEPKERVFIGDKPPKRKLVANNRTRYVESISINKKVNSSLDDIWFGQVKLDLNHDLVAIIGNKGTGKSALAEIIGLLGNTHNANSFSFLSKERFKQPKNNLALHFEGEIHWADGELKSNILNDNVNFDAPEQIKCIPQGLFEDICNEISSGEANKFNDELRKVIFSHVPTAERLGKDSLDSLIQHQTDEISDAIEILKNRLAEKNNQIVEIEKRLRPQYRKQLENQLTEKQSELTAHSASKPETVTQPSEESSDQTLVDQLNTLTSSITGIENAIAQQKTKESISAIKATSAQKVINRLENFRAEFHELEGLLASDIQEIETSFESIIRLTIDTSTVKDKLKAYEKDKQDAANLLNPNIDQNLISQLDSMKSQLTTLQNELSEPSRLYEVYQTELKEWQSSQLVLFGDKDAVGTISYLEHKLNEIDVLPDQLFQAKAERLSIVNDIYKRILSLASEYKKIYSPVQSFNEQNNVSGDMFDLEFDVSIVDQGIEQHFFDWIARNVTGSFYGRQEGSEALKLIIDRHDFNSWDGVQAFLHELMENLEVDKRQSDKSPIEVGSQLRQGKELSSFYNYIFSLDYLRPRYVLKLDGKELSQLSPGERGALLLVFYLLIDKSIIPLIIDQPEENLDNQTVYKHLVNAIKQAKSTRQVIIVTHNPNLAVVCDAEQVICCSIDKKNGNEMTYISGAIESPEINQRIMDILEGTKPAFNNRRLKYAPFQEST
ncbi:MAG: TrlF family AAA-like ATPase [Deinococcota bacterium]